MTHTIAINTPTGKVGSKLAHQLVQDDSIQLVLLVRDPSKIEDLRAGARVEVGNLDDPAFVERALQDVDTLYWASPFSLGSDGTMLASFLELGAIGAEAVRRSGIDRVVQLSVLDVHPRGGSGDIPAGVAAVESMFEDAAANVTHVRATYFMENFMMQLPNLANGQLKMPISGTTRIPMVASADVATVCAAALRDRSWAGHRSIGAHGPADLSFFEARDAIGRGLGIDVSFETISSDEARRYAVGLGLPAPIVNAVVALYEGFERGAFVPSPPRDHSTTTSTTLEQFARTVLAPQLRARAA